MTKLPQMILASGSPRRKELFSLLGLPFEIIVPDVDEEVLPGETPEKLVARLAMSKASLVANKHRSAWVLGADTIVVLRGSDGKAFEILNKPENVADAEKMLKKIQGREHHVYTGFAIFCVEQSYRVERTVRSDVRIQSMTAAEISAYVQTKEPMDKAGAYAAQGIGMMFIQSINGSYSNVVGLPMSEVREEFVRAGLWQADQLLNAK